jgi:spermidine synthase
VIDAYDAEQLATAFTRRSFFAALRRIVYPGGAMAFNLIGTLEANGPLSTLIRAASSEFKNLRILPVLDSEQHYQANALRNIVVIGTA